ncbi:hypothetical protein Anas_06448 [Armadillidium nasatum]|uniref:Uncharacterized protein n=1 Tax=Armadillidium nasatum TaxID=96803 RepID=A0A5N5T991_9CRUS|nr:hypothetical protein Anas_06448 [Armadillidium nasatum]
MIQALVYNVDFSIIDSLTFSNNEVINVLGELALKNEREIKIVAKVVNDFSTINLQEYAKGISYIRETFPNLMRW